MLLLTLLLIDGRLFFVTALAASVTQYHCLWSIFLDADGTWVDGYSIRGQVCLLGIDESGKYHKVFVAMIWKSITLIKKIFITAWIWVTKMPWWSLYGKNISFEIAAFEVDFVGKEQILKTHFFEIFCCHPMTIPLSQICHRQMSFYCVFAPAQNCTCVLPIKKLLLSSGVLPLCPF